MTWFRAVAGLILWFAVAAGQSSWAGSGALQPQSQTETDPSIEPSVVSFDFEHDGLAVPHWSIEIGRDGLGRYRDLSVANDASAVQQPLRVGVATYHRLAAGFGKVRAGNCETRIKHLANTGTKKISYRGPGDTWVSCTFNYSDDKGLMDAAAAFQAIANTLQEGQQLEHLHRYDRLGLDAEMDGFVKEVSDGDAIELGNIAPVLQAIVEDERVIERVRRKSARLLQNAGAQPDSQQAP